MTDKYEWRKQEKPLYLPKDKPEIVTVPEFQFLTVSGEGNPNGELFSECVNALYSLSYAMKMTLKKLSPPPKGYCDYTVYPLEGIWDINEQAKQNFTGEINKDDLVYTLMIRQPEFVDANFVEQMRALVSEKNIKKKEINAKLPEVKFESLSEGKCVQMLHLGPFETESETFAQMEQFASEQGLTRLSKIHREIYLSDPRKVAPEKLKTVLRFSV